MTRIATTHVGSLPRGQELVPLLQARDRGEAYDEAEFDRVVQSAIDEAVQKQVVAGVGIVWDGEPGTIGCSRYISRRCPICAASSPPSWASRSSSAPRASRR